MFDNFKRINNIHHQVVDVVLAARQGRKDVDVLVCCLEAVDRDKYPWWARALQATHKRWLREAIYHR